MKKELFEKRNKLLNDYKTLQDETKTRDWTNEDETRSANMLDELETIDKAIEREERFEKIEVRTNDAINRPAVEDRKHEDVSDVRKQYRQYLRTGESRGLSEGTNSAGGFTAPADLARDLLTIVIEQSDVRKYSTTVETSLASIPFPRKNAGPSASWVAEGGTVSSSQSAYSNVSVAINKLAFFTQISQELLQDSLFDMEAQILNDIAIECSRAEEAAFIAGSGTNQPVGLITVASNGVSATKSGTNGSFTADNLIALMYSLKAPYIETGRFFINRQTFSAIVKMKTSGGNYVFSPLGFGVLGGQGFAPTILNRPFSLTPDMPVSVLGGGTGTPYSVLYTDPKVSYRIVQKPTSQLLSIVRDPYTAANTGNMTFWASWRVGGGVVMPEAVAVLQESV